MEKVFGLMQKYNMKLNLLKCAFGVSVGKFPDFLVTQREIEVNSDQVKVVLERPISSTKKGSDSWAVWFITHFTHKLHNFFTNLCEGAQTFGWTKECKKGFDTIKHYLIELPILSSSEVGGEL